jgi:5-methylcytosine-specific restriction enzyme subunit McrC
VVAGPSAHLWEIRTGAKVGIVVGDDWEFRVTPKLDVPRIMFLLAYAQDPHGWKQTVAHFEREDDVAAAIASGFSWHATWALDRGLLRGYVEREESRHDVRGRIAFAAQIASAGDLPLPIRVRYDDFTEDVLENRILRTATQLLLRFPRIPTPARKRLLRVRATLDAVSPLTEWRSLECPPITRLNIRYEPALRLAALVLAGTSINAAVGDVRSTTFVFDMNKVFEDFVTTAFREAMRPHGGEVRDQVTSTSLDEAGELRLRPDLTWWRRHSCAAVLDAKYKAIDEGLMKHPDAYQMLAYCVAYGLERGYLVYAHDSGELPRTHTIRHVRHDIIVTTVDVEQEPDALLAQVASLAGRVAAEASQHAVPA